MKTAQEWATDIANKYIKQKPMIWPSDSLELVRAIQLDALKQGMTDAAEIAYNYDGSVLSRTQVGIVKQIKAAISKRKPI